MESLPLAEWKPEPVAQALVAPLLPMLERMSYLSRAPVWLVPVGDGGADGEPASTPAVETADGLSKTAPGLCGGVMEVDHHRRAGLTGATIADPTDNAFWLVLERRALGGNVFDHHHPADPVHTYGPTTSGPPPEARRFVARFASFTARGLRQSSWRRHGAGRSPAAIRRVVGSVGARLGEPAIPRSVVKMMPRPVEVCQGYTEKQWGAGGLSHGWRRFDVREDDARACSTARSQGSPDLPCTLMRNCLAGILSCSTSTTSPTGRVRARSRWFTGAIDELFR
jgi:hypothetical protein